MGAVALLNDPHGLGLGHRHITISTVGLVPKIEHFADEGCRSISRSRSTRRPTSCARSIMPVNRRWPVAELMAACERYVAKTSRKVFFEYVMLDGVNDDDDSARDLAELMRGHLYHVNLIPTTRRRSAAAGHGRAAHPGLPEDPRRRRRPDHRAHADGPRHRRRLRPARKPKRNRRCGGRSLRKSLSRSRWLRGPTSVSLALALPGTAETTSYGNAAWAVGDKTVRVGTAVDAPKTSRRWAMPRPKDRYSACGLPTSR